MFKRILPIVIFVLAVVLIVSPVLANFTNGGFETGDLSGWSTYEDGDGAWAVVGNGYTSGCLDGPVSVFEGSYALLAQMDGPNTLVAWQDVTIPINATTLYIDLDYNNSAEDWDFTGVLNEINNQHIRIDVMDPAAGDLSMAGADIWTTIFATDAASPYEFRGTVSGDVSAWAGQTVRVRLAKVDSIDCLPTLFDNLRFDIGPVGYDKIGQIRVVAPGVALYQEAGGGVVRDASLQEIWVPNQTADNPYEDTYDVIAQVEVDGVTWVQIFVGSLDFVWVPVGGPVQVIAWQ